MRFTRPVAVDLVLAGLVSMLSAIPAGAQTGVWGNAAGGSLGEAGNWSGGVLPGFGAGVVLDFSTLNLAGQGVLRLDGDRTAGTLLFGDAVTASHDWTVEAGVPAGSAFWLSGAEVPVIQVNNQTTDVRVGLAGMQGFEKRGAGVLKLSGGGGLPSGAVSVVAGSLVLDRTPGLNGLAGPLAVTGSGALTATAGEQLGEDAVLTLNSSAVAGTLLARETLKSAAVTGGASPLRLGEGVKLTEKLEVAAGQAIVTSAVTPVRAERILLSGGTVLVSPEAGASSMVVGAGGVTATGGSLTIGTATGANAASVVLGGDFTASGSVLVHDGAHTGTQRRELLLGNGLRTFDIRDGVTTVNADVYEGSVLKTGGGTLVLGTRSLSALSGPLTVAGGGLLVEGNLLNTSVAVADGAAFGGKGRLAGTANLTMGTGGTTFFDVSTLASTAMLVDGNVNVNGPVTVRLAPGPSVVAGTPLTILTFGGTLNGGVGLFQLQDAAKFRSQVFSLSGNAVRVDLGTRALKWTGAAGPAWETKGVLNWDSAGASDFAWGDRVTFDDSASVSNVVVNGNVAPSSVTVNNTSKDFLLEAGAGGEISGTALLTKQGPGLLTVAVPFRGTDRTLIQGGTLQVGNGGAVGNLSSGSVVNSGVLRFNRSDALTVANVISGVGSVVQAGAGTVHLSASNTFSGGTRVVAGTLTLGAETSLGAVPTVFDADNLVLDGGGLAAPVSLTLNDATRGMTLGTAGGRLQAGDGQTLTLTVPVTGPGAVSVQGRGTVLLSVANDFAGGAAVAGGKLRAGAAGALGTGPVAVAAGAQAYLAVAGNFPNEFRLSGKGVVDTTGEFGALRVVSGTVVQGPVALSGNVRVGVAGAAEATPAVLAGGFRQEGPGLPGTLELGGNTTSGVVSLTGASAFGGRVEVVNAMGIIGHGAALGSGPVLLKTQPATTSGPATRLRLADGVTVGNALTVGAVNASSTRAALEGPASGTATWAGPIEVGAPLASGGLLAGGGGTLVLTGTLTSAVPVAQRSGQVVYAGGGSYPALSVTGEALSGMTNGICPAATVSLGASGDAVLNLNGYHQEVAGLSRVASVTQVTNTSAQPSVLTVRAGKDSTYSGGIQGGNRLALVKTGPASLTLSGTATHAGTTMVEAGTLAITGSLTSSPVTVLGAGTLAGTGTLSSNVVCDGTVAPGAAAGGIGRLTCTAAVALNGNSVLDWQVGSWSGTAGSGYDTLTLDSLAVNALPGLPVKVRIKPLNLTNFTDTSKVFTLATVANVQNFNPASFSLDASTFGLGGGTWSIRQVSNRVELVYTPGTAGAYSLWASAQGLSGGDAAVMADPDGDGAVNGLEFALNGSAVSPLAQDKVRVREVKIGGQSVLSLTLPVRAGAVFTLAGAAQTAPIAGIRYRIEASANLTDWTVPVAELAPAVAEGMPALDSGWEYRTFTAVPQERVYLRVAVSPWP